MVKYDCPNFEVFMFGLVAYPVSKTAELDSVITKSGNSHQDKTSHWLPPEVNWTCRDALPYGWEVALDDNGKPYFINHLLNNTSCDDPREDESLFLVEREVKLMRDSILGFGFVAGSEKPVVVRSVTEGGPCDGKLFAGDEILRINNEDVKMVHRDYIINKVRSCQDFILLTVAQPSMNKTSGRKSSLLSISKKLKLKSNPSRVRFTEEIHPNMGKILTGCDIKLTGCDIKLTGCDINLTGCDIKLTGCDIKLTGCDIKLTGCDIKLTGCDIKLTGCDINLTGCDINLTGCDIKLTGCDIKLTGKLRVKMNKFDNCMDVCLVKSDPSLLYLPSVLKVYLENGQTKSFKYDSKTTVKDVITILQQKLGINSMEHFSLLMQDMNSPSKSKLSFLQEHETLQKISMKPNSHQWKCLFRVSFVPKDAYDLLRTDPAAFDYFYIQCCNDVVEGRYGSELKYDVAIRLAALQIQEHVLNSKQTAKISIKALEKDCGLDKFLPESVLQGVKLKDVRRTINHYIKMNQNLIAPGQKRLTALQAKLHYLKIVGEIRLFGGRSFTATLMIRKDLTSLFWLVQRTVLVM
ncbi:FERM and PDZ domain-containing protein 4-like [Glandiceps talaboti]